MGRRALALLAHHLSTSAAAADRSDCAVAGGDGAAGLCGSAGHEGEGPLAGYGLAYIEYFSRRPGVELADFRNAVSKAVGTWEGGDADDQMLVSAGRTWRLGPDPEYLTVWHSPRLGLDRLDGWDAAFRGGGHEAEHIRTFRSFARIEVAGCYEPLLPPVAATTQAGAAGKSAPAAVYYMEYFRPSGTHAAIRSLFRERAARAAVAMGGKVIQTHARTLLYFISVFHTKYNIAPLDDSTAHG
jgi:hypothetical protein